MIQSSALNIKLSNLLLNKWKCGIKDGNEVTFKILSNVFSDSNDEINFLYKWL